MKRSTSNIYKGVKGEIRMRGEPKRILKSAYNFSGYRGEKNDGLRGTINGGG